MNINDITIRTNIEPGDLGYVVYRHGVLYSREYNYGVSFETYVGAGLHEFYTNFDPVLDRAWIAEHNQKTIGFLLLMHRENNTAQLRYFYLEPAYRNIGLGKKMMALYMAFLQQCGYTRAYLWTTHELSAAAALYSRYGFMLTEEKDSSAFGKRVREQRYDLVLKK